MTALTLRTPSGLAVVAPSWYWRPGGTLRSSPVTGVAAWVLVVTRPASHRAALDGLKLSQLNLPVRSTCSSHVASFWRRPVWLEKWSFFSVLMVMDKPGQLPRSISPVSCSLAS